MTFDTARQQRDFSSGRSSAGPGEFIGRAILRRIVSNVATGRLAFVTPAGATIEHSCGDPDMDGTLIMRRWRMLRRLLAQGDLGFAKSYLDGDWTSPDLAGLIAVADRNIHALMRYIDGVPLLRLASKLRHKANANTRTGSRKNIEAHYDLGNDFYKLWLDESMTYSSAIFAREEDTLEAAQQRKIARIVELLDAAGGENVLEIGCGWGALSCAIAAAGASHVTGLTLSPSQRQIAIERAALGGNSAAVDIRLEDYRDVTGSFDRIVSVEMIEAVGVEFWPVYFQTIHDRLKPGGHAIVQAITIAEDRFDVYRSSVDFIQQYIFPGGMLPTDKIMHEQAANAGMKATCVETFGQSYARTLAIWRERFLAAWPEIAKQGFDEKFRRMWEYYLAYCEAGFSNGTIDVGLYRLERPAA